MMIVFPFADPKPWTLMLRCGSTAANMLAVHARAHVAAIRSAVVIPPPHPSPPARFCFRHCL